jgi:hypothetical protein
MMTKQDYRHSFDTLATPSEVIRKIAMVSKWWGEDVAGKADSIQDQFTIRFGETSVEFCVTELQPERKVVWTVTGCHLEWLNNKQEWLGNQLVFEVDKTAGDTGGTRVTLTHEGLTPSSECYKGCEEGWNFHFGQSLRQFLETGKGEFRSCQDK